ncbi:histidine kinase [Pontiellaceae bacterium B1224]|nr:histidine kinase [Pontiellaceae bacterium B1224]
MKLLTLHSAVLFLIGLLSSMASAQIQKTELQKMELAELEHYLDDIDSELEQLAALTLRRGVGSSGYRSSLHGQPDTTEWIRIELGEETTIDEVVLVPMLWSDSQTDIQSEGFPRAFRVLAGMGKSTNVVATVTEEDHVTPRIAPLTISFLPVKASWVIIEANILNPRLTAKHYFLQLSEVMVFSGMENVALYKPVKVPAQSPETGTSIEDRFIVDGFTPYMLNASSGAQSKTLVIAVTETLSLPTLTIDLKAPYPINQINLHSAGLPHAIPMENFTSWAVPRHVRVMGANQPDFSDATALCEYQQTTIYENGPAMMLRFQETQCRYVRVDILDHHPVVSLTPNPPFIAFSEIEVISEGNNVALHAPITTSANLSYREGTLARITDGLNYYGDILPLKVWMNQLSRRHDLETLRPHVAKELNRRYDQQKINLRITRWLAAALAVGIVISSLIGRIMRMRQKSKLQERFAADLHDELGADLHTIGLLSDLAGEPLSDPRELSRLLKQIRTTTEETGEAVRQCATMHMNVPYLNLGATMKQIAERVVVQLEHEFTIEGAEHLNKLKPMVRSDLVLFYKEALINICRHAEASKLEHTHSCNITEN